MDLGTQGQTSVSLLTATVSSESTAEDMIWTSASRSFEGANAETLGPFSLQE